MIEAEDIYRLREEAALLEPSVDNDRCVYPTAMTVMLEEERRKIVETMACTD